MRSRKAGSAAMSNRPATERAACLNAGCSLTSLTRSPSTNTRRPSLSERRYSAPVRIRPYCRMPGEAINWRARCTTSPDAP